MSKAKIYKIGNKYNKEDNIKSFIVGIVVYAIVLLIAASIFRGIYVKNFIYAIIAALILSLLNSTIKPLLIILTLPLNIVTCGITYPIVNIIILKLCDFFMGSAFELNGIISSFIIAIFISIFKMILDNIITKKVK